MWAQCRNRQPLNESVTPGRTVATSYMHWFYENGKPFIMTAERTLEFYKGLVHSDLDNNVALVQPLRLLGVDNGLEHLSLYYGPSDERFFAGAFQPYSSMMTVPLHSPGQFFPSPHQFQTSVAPLTVYPLQGPDYSFTYGMVHHTPQLLVYPVEGLDLVTKQAVLEAIKLGYRRVDTFSLYSLEPALGETIIEAVSLGLIKSRNKLFITSKLWCTHAYGDLVLPALKTSLQYKH
ncbi:hypothetical protein V6N13_140172 [Hibiscus sabdariffa]